MREWRHGGGVVLKYIVVATIINSDIRVSESFKSQAASRPRPFYVGISK